MEQVNKLLEQTAYVLLFCLGISCLLLSCKNMSNTVGLLKNSISRQNVLREEELVQGKDKERILAATRAEIIGYLTGSLEANIIIDGVSYKKDSFDKETFDYSILPEGSYNKEYLLDEKNLITEIIFTHTK